MQGCRTGCQTHHCARPYLHPATWSGCLLASLWSTLSLTLYLDCATGREAAGPERQVASGRNVACRARELPEGKATCTVQSVPVIKPRHPLHSRHVCLTPPLLHMLATGSAPARTAPSPVQG